MLLHLFRLCGVNPIACKAVGMSERNRSMVEEPNLENCSKQPEEVKQKRSVQTVVRFAAILFGTVLLAVLVTYSVVVNHYSAKESEAAYRFRVLQQYLDSVAYYDYDYDSMLDEAIRAYVDSSGDDYTIYYDAEEFEQLSKVNQGNYVGIGVTAEKGEAVYQNKTVKVLRIATVRKDSPAQKAGLLKGDEILAITTETGTTQVDDVSYSEASALIRGEVGSTVGLSVLREVSNEKIRIDVEVLREELYLESVEYRVSETDATVGILSIATFDLTTPNSLEEGINALLEKGVRHFVIDLRENGGGDLESVMACASFFLQKNDVILSTRDKNGKESVYTVKERKHSGEYETCNVYAQDIGKYRGYSYVILINGNTASAAELLAAVFRDYSLGTVVGEQSYGKGSMQGLYSLSRIGLEGGIRVTTKMYFPPCGEGYNGVGIAPDIAVSLPKDKIPGMIAEADDTQLMCAIETVLTQKSK